MVYFALCQSLMSYALLAWGHAASTARIFRLQRRALRIVCGLGYRDDCRESFRECEILTFPCLYIYECLLYVKTHESDLIKHCDIHDHQTRNNQSYLPNFYRLKKSQGNCKYQGIQFYNKIPHVLRNLPLPEFRKAMKSILVTNAFYSCGEYLNFVF